jgi:hypothetical protein
VFIPNGTIYIADVWHMDRDSKIYGENAIRFDPTPHLDASGDVAPNLPDTKEGHVSYEFGRRQCPGRHAANSSLFIEIAIMLWEMEIERKKDASGQLFPLDMDGFVGHGIGVLAELSHTFELMLTCVVRQTTCPV